MTRITASILILFMLPPVAFAVQTSSRPQEAVEAESTAREFFKSGYYAEAIPLLEKTTVDYPLDLTDLSLLGMAYLYSSSRLDLAANVKKALEANTKVVELGGEAVFLVGRGNDPHQEYVSSRYQGNSRRAKSQQRQFLVYAKPQFKRGSRAGFRR